MKLDMLEVVDSIACTGKVYPWAQYVANMLKTVCEKCKESDKKQEQIVLETTKLQKLERHAN